MEIISQGAAGRIAGSIVSWALARRSFQPLAKAMFVSGARGLGYLVEPDLYSSGEADLIVKAYGMGARTWIDVGANRGAYSRLVLELPDTKVAAFEPLPSLSQGLRLLQAEFPDRFNFFDSGLGAKTEDRLMAFAPEVPAWSTFMESPIHYHDGMSETRVSVKTADSLFQEGSLPPDLDFLKVDVEGWEAEVLVGAERYLREVRPMFIQLEFNKHQLERGHSMLSLARLLPPDYELFQILPFKRGLSFRNVAAPESSVGYFSNFVFLRADVARNFLPKPRS